VFPFVLFRSRPPSPKKKKKSGRKKAEEKLRKKNESSPGLRKKVADADALAARDERHAFEINVAPAPQFYHPETSHRGEPIAHLHERHYPTR
jgi:hypothetical protein